MDKLVAVDPSEGRKEDASNAASDEKSAAPSESMELPTDAELMQLLFASLENELENDWCVVLPLP
ncbi:hypothetical protein [Aromatoleum toluclasticum]|uniref:hypothetical protein n=1 Tax=Aromatoleum toluclasticum TaxID=92003 RepID=UPI001E5E4F23|nr:hypothetical protein [Aromatoleum toluclasticum]